MGEGAFPADAIPQSLQEKALFIDAAHTSEKPRGERKRQKPGGAQSMCTPPGWKRTDYAGLTLLTTTHAVEERGGEGR